MSEMRGAGDMRLWDRLFVPLVAATTGSVTMILLQQPNFEVAVAPFPGMTPIDLLTGPAVALGAVAVGLLLVWAFPHAYRLFHKLRHPVLMTGLGGCLLGVLALVGGQITMFEGVAQMKRVAADPGVYGVSGLMLIVAVKLVAILIAASSGFRGGRIFPAAFIGVTLGVLANQLVPAIPVSLAIGCAVMGFMLVVTRHGWLSLFLASVVIPDLKMFPLLCVALLPAWLALVGRPSLLITTPGGRHEGAAAGAAKPGRGPPREGDNYRRGRGGTIRHSAAT